MRKTVLVGASVALAVLLACGVALAAEITCPTGANGLCVGTPDDDTLTGTDAIDKMYAQAGVDTLYGKRGADVMEGGGGNDSLYGNGAGLRRGNVLWGDSSTSETISGNDYLIGGSRNDRIYGGPGSDRIRGNLGNDYIEGQGGNDALSGGPANDSYAFGSGWGVDRITGEPTTSRDGLAFSIGCEHGYPQCVTADLTIHLTPGASSPEATDGTNTLNWEGQVIDDATGGWGNDTITGNSDSNRLSGSAGNDTINTASGAAEAGGADDFLYGDVGNDTINSVAGAPDFAGAPELDGAQGDDTINAANGGLDIVDCGDHVPGGVRPPDDDVANVDADDWVAPNFFEPSRSSCETINIISE